MILVKFSGGLGNQIFQYAIYRQMQERYSKTAVKADISSYKLYDVHYGFELDEIFELQKRGLLQIASVTEQYTIRGEIPIFMGGATGKILEVPIAWLNARSRQHFQKRNRRHVISEDAVDDSQCIEDELEHMNMQCHWYLDGYWQNEQYYRQILPKIREELIFPMFTEQDIENRRWSEEICQTMSVSIHVRRGDYVDSIYDILTMQYYQDAVKYMCEHLQNPVFYIFSEDKEYIEREFGWLERKVIMSGNRGQQSWRDMQLMSLCRHNIIANSSFSVWAGYLNRNVEKLVCYPSRYTKELLSAEHYESGWHKIEVK